MELFGRAVYKDELPIVGIVNQLEENLGRRLDFLQKVRTALSLSPNYVLVQKQRIAILPESQRYQKLDKSGGKAVRSTRKSTDYIAGFSRGHRTRTPQNLTAQIDVAAGRLRLRTIAPGFKVRPTALQRCFLQQAIEHESRIDYAQELLQI